MMLRLSADHVRNRTSLGPSFEGRLEGIFDLRDRVTASLVGAITPKLEQAEMSVRNASPPVSYLADWRA